MSSSVRRLKKENGKGLDIEGKCLAFETLLMMNLLGKNG